jgi:uncharacterized metal-binding protein YceD (DUF177 family)
MIRINFSVEQARKVLATVPAGTHYWHEAQRCLAEAGVPLHPPVQGLDAHPPIPQDDDDGYPD